MDEISAQIQEAGKPRETHGKPRLVKYFGQRDDVFSYEMRFYSRSPESSKVTGSSEVESLNGIYLISQNGSR